MAKISYREKVLLGYNPNSLSNSSSRRNSEVDFSDVFGGPPRCSSSTQEYYNNDIDSDIGDDAVDDDDDGSWYFGLRERPVFGDQFGVQRRHYGSDDFYDDIFGGDQLLLSCSLSPRVHMSPSRPSSATAEPSTSPSKFSLAGRVANTDTMNNTSKNQSLTKFLGRSLSRFNQTVQNRLTFNGDDARTSYQPSSLPRQIAVGEKQLTNNSKKTGATDQHEPKFIMEESKGSKFAKDNMQFHFSIYKWANNGVPIAMPSRKRSPSRPKEKVASDANMIKKNSRGDENVNVGMLSSKRRMPFAAQAEREHERNNGMIVGEMRVEYKPEVGKAEKKPTNEADEAHSDEKDVDAKMKKHSQKMKKLNSKPLRTLLGQDKEGNKKATPEKERKQSKANETVKQPSLKDETFPSYKVSRKSKVRESFTGKTDDFRKGDVSGTVKGFVKIFNQGSSHENSYVNTFPTKNHDEMQDSYVDLGKGSFEYIEVVDGESFLSGEQECNINNGSGSVSNSATNDGPSIDGSRASAPQTSAPYVDDNLGKIVAQDIDSPLAIVAEETQDYERKVRQWSKGKEGNIRALLSTMQNILWPNSGWKPIPLVDIIEANGVKKAYQRALLCLHPDKLQQKGAAPHHKFIAEKVFDILQEAWDEFNSIGML